VGVPPNDQFGKRVEDAFEVVDAILQGTLLPEPSPEEIDRLGIADYDPELRYRVARDVLEQWAGKPKQQIEQVGDGVPLIIQLPAHAAATAPPELTPPPKVIESGG
jgi:hypothetical protein